MHVGVWFCSTGDYTVVYEVADGSKDRSQADGSLVAAASSLSSVGWADQDGTVGFVVHLGSHREPIAPCAGPPLFGFLCVIDVCVELHWEWWSCVAAGFNMVSKVMHAMGC